MLAGPRSTSYCQTQTNVEKSKFNEFKYLYFNIQKAINTKVILSLKYDLLKTPEIHSQILKPLTQKIFDISNLQSLSTAGGYGALNHTNKIPLSVVFILLLLRYEFIIQSENNLISFDFLTTKANICEILAIRMLREYKSVDRANLLFIKPMSEDFNTLELAILTKSKKFLSQPIITQIMDKIYNGDIAIVVDKSIKKDGRIFSGAIQGGSIMEPQDEEFSFAIPSSIINYKYHKISINMIKIRSESVPRYQSLVINIKLVVFAILYFFIILKHKLQISPGWKINVIEALFWFIAANFNFEFFVKLRHIRFKFLKKIIWTHIDMILIGLLDVAFLLKVCVPWLEDSSSFHNIFSVISIILLPRILSIFNNYEFFNMIILSCKRMVWKMIGLFCLLISLISGFYISFISLTVDKDKSSSDILFDMLKVFFGFTPAVWNNWDDYNTLGKITQMGYLFFVQFVISSILAIILSEVFHKIAATNKEEFHYFKATNIVIYQQSSEVLRNTTISPFVTNAMDIFKIPIILGIFIYEVIISKFYYSEATHENITRLKHFAFFDKEKDYPNEVHNQCNKNDKKESIIFNSPFIAPSRKYSGFDGGVIKPVHSISTIGNLKSASTDSLFIDDLLNRRYGGQADGVDSLKLTRSKSRINRNENEIIQKLAQIETLFSEVVHNKEPISSSTGVTDKEPVSSSIDAIPIYFEDTHRSPVYDKIYQIREASPLSDVELFTSTESLSELEED